MAKTPIDGRHFQYRNGTPSGGGETFYWKGVATKPDLGAQPADRPRRVVNGRYVGGHIIARPPLAEYEVEVPIIPNPYGNYNYDAQPTFLAEHPSFGGIKIWWGGPIDVSFPFEYGCTFGTIDSDYDPVYHEVGRYYRAADFNFSVAKYAQSIYVGEIGALKRLYRIDAVAREVSYTKWLPPSDEIIMGYQSRAVTGLHSHDGRLYYAVVDPANVALGEIWAWNGVQAVKVYDLTSSGRDGVWMTTYKNTLVVTVVGDTKLHVMAPAGTWSTATVAEFGAANCANNMAEVKGILYIANGTNKIHSWDGTSLTLVRTVPNYTGTTSYLRALAAFNGRLYYTWADAFMHHWPWLGVFDPDTTKAAFKWVDKYKEIGFSDIMTAPSTPTMYFGIPWAMVVYRQRLVVALGCVVPSSAPPAPTMTFVSHVGENNPYSEWYECSPHWNVTHPADGRIPPGPLSFTMRSMDGLMEWPRINFMKVL